MFSPPPAPPPSAASRSCTVQELKKLKATTNNAIEAYHGTMKRNLIASGCARNHI